MNVSTDNGNCHNNLAVVALDWTAMTLC